MPFGATAVASRIIGVNVPFAGGSIVKRHEIKMREILQKTRTCPPGAGFVSLAQYHLRALGKCHALTAHL